MSVDFFKAITRLFEDLSTAIGTGSFAPGGAFVIGSIGEILVATGSLEAPVVGV